MYCREGGGQKQTRFPFKVSLKRNPHVKPSLTPKLCSSVALATSSSPPAASPCCGCSGWCHAAVWLTRLIVLCCFTDNVNSLGVGPVSLITLMNNIVIMVWYSVILDFITRDVRQLVENQRSSRHKSVNKIRVSRLLVQSGYCHSRKIDLGLES